MFGLLVSFVGNLDITTTLLSECSRISLIYLLDFSVVECAEENMLEMVFTVLYIPCDSYWLFYAGISL